jgi:hypothetical protein
MLVREEFNTEDTEGTEGTEDHGEELTPWFWVSPFRSVL